MKYLITFAFLIAFVNIQFAQKFKRADIDYSKYEKESYEACDQASTKKVQEIFGYLETNQSEQALKIADELSDPYSCVDIVLAVSSAKFMSGNWTDAIEFLDKGIKKVGASPGLILRRSEFSVEMYQMGVSSRNVDGMTMYLPESKRLKYDEEKFKKENLRSAAYDLDYLVSNYQSRYEQIFMLAQIYAISEEYEKSNGHLNSLIGVQEYSINALFLQAKNYSSMKQYDEAEKRFLEILENNGKNYKLLQEIGRFYESINKKDKAEEYYGLAEFYFYVPSYLSFEFTEENMELIKYFGGEDSGEEKKKKLEEIFKKSNAEHTAEICLIILKMHANHGNGVEEYAAELLGKTGKSSLDKIHKLFNSNVATCTIGNLGDAMSEIGDQESWEIMVDYLPTIANMPMTLIPPNIPEMVIKFDEEKGMVEVLKVIKMIYNKPPSNDPFMGGFGNYVFFYPLRDLDKETVLAQAKSLDFTDEELEKLKKELEK